MRFAGRDFSGRTTWLPVPDLHLRRAAQVDAAVGLRHGLVFDAQFDVAELLVRRRVRAGAVVDQFAILDPPVLRKLGPLLGEVGLLLLACELGSVVRIQSIPAGEIPAVEMARKPSGGLGSAAPAIMAIRRQGMTRKMQHLRIRCPRLRRGVDQTKRSAIGSPVLAGRRSRLDLIRVWGGILMRLQASGREIGQRKHSSLTSPAC